MRILRIFMISVLLLFINIFSLEKVNASAHELESLDIHVFIEEDGSAIITEKREATLSEGTENYIVIGNLGESTIIDFKVYEDGKMYDYVDEWRGNWKRDEKTFKNSIIKKKKRYELVWGIGEYGKHEYELIYTVTDFIKQVEDSQMMFWQFVNSDTNIPPKRVMVTIETDKALSEKNERIWAFGFEGDIHFDDGKIVAESNRPLNRSDYVTILTKLPNSNFGTNDIIDQTFEEVKEQAFKGSDYKSESLVVTLFKILLIVLIFFGVLFLLHVISERRDANNLKKKYEGKYFREVPYHGEFFMAYGALMMYQFSDLNHVLSAFILEWINEDRVRVVPAIKKGIFRDKEITELHLAENGIDGLKDSEAELFNIFVSASVDGVLKQKDLKSWSKENYKLVSEWESDLMDNSLTKFEEEGYLRREEAEAFGESYKKNHVLPKIQEFKENVHMFKSYLNDFSLLNEHEPVNVKLWDELMIWAALLGITEVVYKEFKKLYPKYEQESMYSYTIITTTTTYSKLVNHQVTSGRSGGFGGAISSGGGGGSFGGGSGGGTR